jgi:hypothetical protein
MKDRQLFENLDTSFVKLDALVRHLCRLSFAGTVMLTFEDYHGEIVLTPTGKLRVTEDDGTAETVRHGQKAFEHIMLRAEKPGGKINVVESEESVHAHARSGVSMGDENSEEAASKLIRHVRIVPKKLSTPRQARAALAELSEFPFELANNFEEAAAFPADSDLGLELMIDVISDLLSSIDDVLDREGLNFSAAFRKACSDVAGKFPFMDPEARLFLYSGGLVYISPEVNLRTLAVGVGEVLGLIFARLAASSKFIRIYEDVVRRVRSLTAARKEEFTRTGMLKQIERAIGRKSRSRSG